MAGGIGQTNYGRLRQRQGTVASLGTADPVPAYGEFLVTYDGSDPVVKIGDGVRSWNDLPNLFGGGGGGGGATPPDQLESWAATPLPLISMGGSERGISDPDIAWGTPYDPNGPPTSTFMTVGTSGKLVLAQGWYVVTAWVGLNFAAAAGVSYVRCAWNIGDNLAGNSEQFLPKSTNSAGQEVFQIVYSFGALYSDGTDYIRPSIRWNTGGPDPVGSVLGVVAVKIA